MTWFAARGVTIERVLSDNGSAYRSHAWRDACAELGITPKRTRPYRPQTNGKIERFHRTLTDGWAFGRFYNSEKPAAKRYRPGSTNTITTGPTPQSGGKPPITRLTNLPGHGLRRYGGRRPPRRCAWNRKFQKGPHAPYRS